MRNIASIPVVAAVLLALFVSPACYTLLKHPKVRQETRYEAISDNQCSNCHSQNELWQFHHPPNHPYPYEIGFNWLHYYQVPWWYDAYWFYDEDDPATIPLHSRGLRPAEASEQVGPNAPMPYPQSPKPVKFPVVTDESQQNKGTTDDSQSKNRTVRPNSKKQKGKEKK